MGVEPVDASNAVAVRYRVNQGPAVTLAASHLPLVGGSRAQYFRATLPALQAGDRVEYMPICHCAGRQVPSPVDAQQFGASFRVVEAGAAVTTKSASIKAAVQQDLSGANSAATSTLLARLSAAAFLPSEKTVLASPFIPVAGVPPVIPDSIVIPAAPFTLANPQPGSVNTELNPIPEQCSITGSIIPPEGSDRASIKVQAFDRPAQSGAPQGSSASDVRKGGNYRRQRTLSNHLHHRAVPER
jgi:hypothetical protein